jgi:hypothetical protein
MNIKTGIELIEAERLEQIFKHGRTVDMDVALNGNKQLAIAAHRMLAWAEHDPTTEGVVFVQPPAPEGWNPDIWAKMVLFIPYKKSLIIAGALIAAEIDRLNVQEAANGAV